MNDLSFKDQFKFNLVVGTITFGFMLIFLSSITGIDFFIKYLSPEQCYPDYDLKGEMSINMLVALCVAILMVVGSFLFDGIVYCLKLLSNNTLVNNILDSYLLKSSNKLLAYLDYSSDIIKDYRIVKWLSKNAFRIGISILGFLILYAYTSVIINLTKVYYCV